jgi:hypothetical protein
MSAIEKLPEYSAGSPKPLFDIGFMEEMERAWAGRHWGAQSHTGKLEAVMVHRPGAENISDDRCANGLGRWPR